MYTQVLMVQYAAHHKHNTFLNYRDVSLIALLLSDDL